MLLTDGNAYGLVEDPVDGRARSGMYDVLAWIEQRKGKDTC